MYFTNKWKKTISSNFEEKCNTCLGIYRCIARKKKLYIYYVYFMYIFNMSIKRHYN